MKTYVLIAVAFFYCICFCQKSIDYVVYARNMSNVSGATLEFGKISDGIWISETIYLPQCPISGIPVEKRSGLTYRGGGEMRWEVVKEIGDTLIGSGTFTMAGDKWLEVNGTDGDWRCTWSDEPWD